VAMIPAVSQYRSIRDLVCGLPTLGVTLPNKIPFSHFGPCNG